MLALLTLALAAAAHAANTTTTLVPVLREGCNKADPANLVPASNITLEYGAKNEKLVSVSLAMKYPSVVLEEVAAVAAVDCAAESITVTFNETAAFEQTSSDWQALDDFVMVTNHAGNCDVQNERGFFVVDTVTFDAATLKVVANAHKSDVANTARKSSTLSSLHIKSVTTNTSSQSPRKSSSPTSPSPTPPSVTSPGTTRASTSQTPSPSPPPRPSSPRTPTSPSPPTRPPSPPP